MKHLGILGLAITTAIGGACVCSRAAEIHELKVHLAQANNHSPYAFVRAKFEPGEVTDPWSVRFFDEQGGEAPYFVWDSITWQIAHEGRPDWGQRYALLNHATGHAPEARQARGQKIDWAKQNLPLLGARLAAQEEAANKAGGSICAAIYLVRHSVPAFGKDRLTLKVYLQRQVEPTRQQWNGPTAGAPFSAEQGDLSFQGLPDRLSVKWRGKELLHLAGFDAGGVTGAFSHADPTRPFKVETSQGIITKVLVTGQTSWRASGAMNWRCTYWLLPEGSYVALEGFSLTDPFSYRGGPQKLSIYAAPQGASRFTMSHEPDWDRPWWLHQVGDVGYLATHLFFSTPLTIGYGNNPFVVNAEGPNKDPRVETDGVRLALRWQHEVDDPAISRLMAGESVLVKDGHMAANQEAFTRQAARWEPRVDWLYRQYVIGLGNQAPSAEDALRCVLGAAAGWIDRPATEEELATLLVGMMGDIGASGQTSEIGLLRVVPAVLSENQAGINAALRDRFLDVVARTDFYMNLIRQSVQQGQSPAGGGKTLPDGTRWEGWTGNPGYHASLMPCYLRVMEFFELPIPQEAYRRALLRYADFGLELLGGNPVDFERFRTVLEGEWPSRTVSTMALMLHAYTLKRDERYAQAARTLFRDLLRLVERNPHGYFPAWSFKPKADKYDTVYNPVSYDRGINSIWFEDSQEVVGREAAKRFVAAQARWFVFSGQLLDTFEMDNVTAIRACNHGAHTCLRNQIGLYLWDDFGFYRGLLAELVTWSAASGGVSGRAAQSGTGPYRRLILSNAGSSMLRWALDIRPGAKWLESKIEPVPGQKGFRLQVWNRRPLAQPLVKVIAREIGLKTDGAAFQVQLLTPAYRQPAEFEVKREDDKISLKASHSAKLRLYFRSLCPDWPEQVKPVVVRRFPGSRDEVVSQTVRTNDSIEWQAERGEYEMTLGNR